MLAILDQQSEYQKQLQTELLGLWVETGLEWSALDENLQEVLKATQLL